MKNKKRITSIILLTARIWGSISLAFLVFMVGAHVIGSLTGGEDGLGFTSTSEIFQFLLFFPAGTIIGLSIALKWPGLGGLITVGGMIGFHIIRPDLIFNPMIDGLMAPGLLYLIYWYLSRGQKETKEIK